MKNAFVIGLMLGLFAIALGAIIAFPVMWMWNGCLVGAVSGISEIGYLQAWGLYILTNFLFKPTVTTNSK